MRRRPAFWLVATFVAFLFLGLSFLLARGLTGSSTERGKVLALIEAQARGDADAVLADLPACRAEAACAETTRRTTEELARPGEVEILTYAPSAGSRSPAARARRGWRGAPASRCPSCSACACAATGRSPAAASSCWRSPRPIGLEAPC